MSDAHKAALAEGREQGRIVRRYLEALEALAGKRSRRRTDAAIEKRLEAIEVELPTVPPIVRLQLVQERIDLRNQLGAEDDGPPIEELEQAFVACAGPYSERKGISYTAWRQIGVSVGVLRQAGIRRLAGEE